MNETMDEFETGAGHVAVHLIPLIRNPDLKSDVCFETLVPVARRSLQSALLLNRSSQLQIGCHRLIDFVGVGIGVVN